MTFHHGGASPIAGRSRDGRRRYFFSASRWALLRSFETEEGGHRRPHARERRECRRVIDEITPTRKLSSRSECVRLEASFRTSSEMHF